ncbi:hypothetical protein BWI93_07655 [Siphonobacter sp. BAB-5385]|uniref:hypothetical protein n=1 Tax=unclassified Siphonobacter TaxID=2635712 RepID=UPI000B9E9561|nr:MULTISPECIES: hypothetical protein [unclassified Siphonobacter]OZI08720.1 hypothetical protein BWI93_07655 [Siphonobacter sp. BAB-5385]PMD99186.1 hypothetical protein BWI97_01910 [Siphonobacter sp. BAB-5405]
MLSSKDYATMTREELVSEEKKINSKKITTAVYIGVLIGIAVYAAINKGFLLPVILIVISFLIGYRNSEEIKNLQAEINRRNTVL